MIIGKSMWDSTSYDLNFEYIKSIDIFIVEKRFMVTKNSTMEIQNLVVNHELTWTLKWSRWFSKDAEVRLIDRLLIPSRENFTRRERLERCILMALILKVIISNLLTLSWRRPLSYRNQSTEWTGFYMITASVMKELRLI